MRIKKFIVQKVIKQGSNCKTKLSDVKLYLAEKYLPLEEKLRES